MGRKKVAACLPDKEGCEAPEKSRVPGATSLPRKSGTKKGRPSTPVVSTRGTDGQRGPWGSWIPVCDHHASSIQVGQSVQPPTRDLASIILWHPKTLCKPQTSTCKLSYHLWYGTWGQLDPGVKQMQQSRPALKPQTLYPSPFKTL